MPFIKKWGRPNEAALLLVWLWRQPALRLNISTTQRPCILSYSIYRPMLQIFPSILISNAMEIIFHFECHTLRYRTSIYAILKKDFSEIKQVETCKKWSSNPFLIHMCRDNTMLLTTTWIDNLNDGWNVDTYQPTVHIATSCWWTILDLVAWHYRRLLSLANMFPVLLNCILAKW